MSEISILLVGNTDRREFRRSGAVLDELGRVVAAADADSAHAVLAGGRIVPDLIVVAQAYPGQFTTESIDRLRRLAPLARVLGLLGSWCEGETRSGEPWPAAIRIYWHQWLPRVATEIADLREGVCSTWALPMTASEEERQVLVADKPFSKREGLIVISAVQFDVQDWLVAACARRGYSTIWLRPDRPVEVERPTAAVFDGDQCRGAELRALKQLAAALGPVPIVALLDFPRAEDRDRALAAGAAAVISKPLLIEDLFWQIDRLAGQEPSAGGP